MKTRIFALGALILAAGISVSTQAPTGAPAGQAPGGRAGAGRGPAGPGFTLTTPAFPDGSEIPAKYTQLDPNPVSPKLEWTNVPANTVTFALIMNDPDVARMRTTEDMLHWLAFNIPGTARELPEGVATTAQLPDGTVQAKNGGNHGRPLPPLT